MYHNRTQYRSSRINLPNLRDYYQARALEARTNAWDKRVNTARKARLQQEEESSYSYPPPPPSSSSTHSPPRSPHVNVLSNEEVKAREVQSAQAQMGFNPYAATFSSSAEAGAVINSIASTSTGSAVVPPPAPLATAYPSASASSSSSATPAATAAPSQPASTSENGAVFVVLCQPSAQALLAIETIQKILHNIVQNPTVRSKQNYSHPFRRIQVLPLTVAFAAIQI